MNIDTIVPNLLKNRSTLYTLLSNTYTVEDVVIRTNEKRYDSDGEEEKDVNDELLSYEMSVDLILEGFDEVTITLSFQKANKIIHPLITIVLDTILVGRKAIEKQRRDLLKITRIWVGKEINSYNRSVRRCLEIKEELMASAWHPKRVTKMLEYGMDVEDM
jgi:hypothetical protein